MDIRPMSAQTRRRLEDILPFQIVQRAKNGTISLAELHRQLVDAGVNLQEIEQLMAECRRVQGK